MGLLGKKRPRLKGCQPNDRDNPTHVRCEFDNPHDEDSGLFAEVGLNDEGKRVVLAKGTTDGSPVDREMVDDVADYTADQLMKKRKK